MRPIPRPGFLSAANKVAVFNNDFTNNTPNDGRIVCTRANAVGTYFDVNNKMQTAAANTLRTDYGPVALGTTNFFWPSFVNSATIWNNLTGAAWVKNADVAPDGTKTAGLLVADSSTGPHWSTPSVNNNVAFLLPSTTYTYSVFLKAGTTTRVSFGFGNSTNWLSWPITLAVDLQAQTVSGANGTGVITPYANGWFRVSMSATTAASGLVATFLLLGANNSSGTASYTGAGQSFYAWGFQCEIGPVATDLVPTLTAKVIVPKSLGLLVEESRTNFLLQSDILTNAAWTAANGSVTANAVTSPDGNVLGDSFIPSAVNTVSHTLVQTSQTVSAGATVTASAYFQPAGYNYAMIRCGNAAETSAFQAVVDLTNGTLLGGSASAFGTGAVLVSASVVPSGAWSRLLVSGSVTTQTTYKLTIYYYSTSALTTYSGDTVSGIATWGTQIEVGGFATSYIPTTSATLTRAADLVTLPLGTWANPAAGTLAVTAQQAAQYSKAVCVLALQEASTNRTSINVTGGNAVAMFDQTAGLNAGLGTPAAGSVWKATFAYRATSQVGDLNGAAVTTQALTITTVPVTMAIGSVFNGSFYNGWIAQIRYWNYMISNAAVIASSS